ncbi:hypothetical protein GNV82_20730 [Escherichia coli]|nr:hypothetical protein [Escherichia coli]
MKLETIQIDNTVRSGLNSFTDGVIIRDTKVLIMDWPLYFHTLFIT